MNRFLVADDHPVVREGVETMLAKEFPGAFIQTANGGAELMQYVIRADWDLVISDLSMPGKSGLETLEEIKKIKPRLPVLILSMHPEESYAIKALKQGASGYVTKDMVPADMLTAIHRVLSGRKYITLSLAEKLAGQFDTNNKKLPHENLSNRELSVLHLLGAGKKNSEIATLLSVSISTVSTFRSRILTKLNLSTSAEIIHYAISNHL